MRNCFQSVVRLCVSSFFHKLWFQKLKDTPLFRRAGWSPAAKWRGTVACAKWKVKSEESMSPAAKWKVKSEEWKIKVSFVSDGRRVKGASQVKNEEWRVKNYSYLCKWWTKGGRFYAACCVGRSGVLINRLRRSEKWRVKSEKSMLHGNRRNYIFDHGLLGLNGWIRVTR